MKQVKSLILAVFLVFALSIGAHGGDMGSPGIRTTTTGDMGSPTTKTTTPVYTVTATTTEETDTNKNELEDLLVMEMMLVLLALF